MPPYAPVFKPAGRLIIMMKKIRKRKKLNVFICDDHCHLIDD